MAVAVVVVAVPVRGQFRRARAARRGRTGFEVVLQLGPFVLASEPLGALFRVLGDALGGDAGAPFAHVSSQRALLLLLAERARVPGGFARFAGLALTRSCRLVPLLLLFLHSSALGLGRTVECVLQRAVRELFVVPIERVPERPVLDAIAHVVHIHPEGERFGWLGLACGGGYRDNVYSGEANVDLERARAAAIVGLLEDLVLNEVSRIVCYERIPFQPYYELCSTLNWSREQ